MKYSIVLCTIPMRKKALERLLESIKKYTTDYEVLIHDEAKKHMTVADAWNELTEKAQGEFIQYLNDDMEVTENWLDSHDQIYKFLEDKGEKVGELQSCIWCNGQVQSRGGAFIGAQLAIVGGMDELKKIDYSNMPFIRKKVWEELGGFVPYADKYYDDSDFGLRCLKAGYSNWYNPFSKIIHYTLGQKAEDGEAEVEGRKIGEGIIQQQAREGFMRVWKDWLEKRK